MQTDQEIVVEVIALAFGGSCIATTTDGPAELIGKKAFLRNAIPGEIIKARVTKDQKRFLEAEIIEVIEASPSRVAAPCQYFGTCGGCDLQHMAIACQRNEKMRMVTDMLRMQAGVVADKPPVMLASDLPAYSYRRRAAFHIDVRGQIGFFKPNSGEVVDMQECLTVCDAINQGLKMLRPYLNVLSKEIRGVVFEEFNGDLFTVLQKEGSDKSFHLPPPFLVEFKNLKIKNSTGLIFTQGQDYPAGHFSQVNEAANKVLSNTILKLCLSDVITELYAGSGNFGIPLALNGKQVCAVEVDSNLVEHGRAIAKNAGVLSKIKFFNQSCENFLKSNKLQGEILLDPPRSGAKNILSFLIAAEVKRVIYISCNLPSLARDVKLLTQNSFQLDELYLLDMFPQTHHIESICVLQRA